MEDLTTWNISSGLFPWSTMVLLPKFWWGYFFNFIKKSTYCFASSNKITHQTLGFLDVNSTSIHCSKVIMMLKQSQISCLLGKVEIILFSFYLFFHRKKYFFAWGFQIGMFDGNRSEECAFCFFKNLKGEQLIINNRYIGKWIHVAIILSSIFWPRVNIFKYISSTGFYMFSFLGYL